MKVTAPPRNAFSVFATTLPWLIFVSLGGEQLAQMIKSSRDIILRTNRWPEAVQFYETALGFKVISLTDTTVGFDTGALVLYVEKGAEHGPVFDFLTADVQVAKERLVAAGCSIVEENPTVPRCYLKDPFGLVFNLGTKDSGV